MQVEIGNCSGGNDYTTVEASWLNIMPSDWKIKHDNLPDDDEGYCNIMMTIKKEELNKLERECIINLSVSDDTGETLLVTFFTCDDINIKE